MSYRLWTPSLAAALIVAGTVGCQQKSPPPVDSCGPFTLPMAPLARPNDHPSAPSDDDMDSTEPIKIPAPNTPPDTVPPHVHPPAEHKPTTNLAPIPPANKPIPATTKPTQ